MFAALAIVLTSVVQTTATAAPAQAWSATNFNAGRIIDDALFYKGNAMTTSQVKSFLKKRLGRCTIGDSGRKAGKTWGSTKIAKACLRNFTMKTSSRASNSNCKAYRGSKKESAAQIITKVSRACGISPKVLLVMLEKEQSLVTDSWPTVRQFNVAMGYACPDSGPNNSANCNSKYFGFFNQVYWGAWQLKQYRAKPQNYNFQRGATVNVQWHPNASCGTSRVRIQNHATAALYTYTPYRPNQAALRAGWGTGDRCSSYGNRNFYNYWNSWFGSVRSGIKVTGAIKTVHQRNGAAYGGALSPRKTIKKNGGGYEQRFENGVITYSKKLRKAYGVFDDGTTDRWASRYLAAGGAAGSWGFIAGTVASPGHRNLKFQRGTAISNSTVGVRFIPAPVYRAWLAGGGQSTYGWPNATALFPTGTSASQRFQKGTLMVSGGRVQWLTAAETAQWQRAGGHATLGFFTGPSVEVGTRSYRNTERGVLYRTSPGTSVFVPSGAYRSAYSKAGGLGGAWGWPTQNVAKIGAGSRLTFQNGVAVYSKKAGVVFLTKAAYNDWRKKGGYKAKSSLGFPTQSTRVVSDGSYQRYAKHVRFFGPQATVLLKLDPIVRAYLNAGGPRGAWGWPTSGLTQLSKTKSQIRFSGGIATYTKSGGVRFAKAAASRAAQTPPEAPVAPAEDPAEEAPSDTSPDPAEVSAPGAPEAPESLPQDAETPAARRD
ncbi:hypothetical protein [Leucobacter weissii]